MQSNTPEIIEGNKYIAVRFMSWFHSQENTELVEKILTEMPPTENATSDLYDIWFEKYFVPDTINNQNPKP